MMIDSMLTGIVEIDEATILVMGTTILLLRRSKRHLRWEEVKSFRRLPHSSTSHHALKTL
jgi:hypothetical protein